MSNRAAVQLLLALCFAAVHTASAQLVPGDRVRIVHAADTNVVNTGDLVSVTQDSLVFRDDSSHLQTSLPRDSILAVERRMVIGHRAWRGAGIGFLVGTVTGAVGGAASVPCGSGPAECWKGLAAGFFGLVGGVLGSLGGAVIGAHVEHAEWAPVALPPRGSADR